MVDFNRKRLQVFVSSTYTDLIDERQAAVEAILSHGHIPAGMELFTSGDESQMEVIKQWIEDSDVYLLILGGRYGSIEPNSGKSYTQLEYEYAIELGKPYFACVVNEAAQARRLKEHGSKVTETENPKELKAFRQLVDSKIRKEWDDIKDIKIIVGETLGAFARREDLVGWVRADQVTVNPAVAEEMARLSKENEQLRSQIANGIPTEEMIDGLSFSEFKMLLEHNGLLEIIKQATAPEIQYWHNVTMNYFDEIKIKNLGFFEDDSTIKLTNSGHRFINKLKLEELKLKKDS
jgi:nucleoside 2-deoxyribosyltransferase